MLTASALAGVVVTRVEIEIMAVTNPVFILLSFLLMNLLLITSSAPYGNNALRMITGRAQVLQSLHNLPGTSVRIDANLRNPI